MDTVEKTPKIWIFDSGPEWDHQILISFGEDQDLDPSLLKIWPLSDYLFFSDSCRYA